MGQAASVFKFSSRRLFDFSFACFYIFNYLASCIG